MRGVVGRSAAPGSVPALPVAQAEGAQTELVLGAGQRVGLGVGHHLKLVLDVAQEHVGPARARASSGARSPFRETRKGGSGAALPKSRVAPTMPRLEDLGHELDLADPSDPELDVPVGLVPRRDLPVDIALDPADLLDLLDRRPAVDEGPDPSRKRAPECYLRPPARLFAGPGAPRWPRECGSTPRTPRGTGRGGRPGPRGGGEDRRGRRSLRPVVSARAAVSRRARALANSGRPGPRRLFPRGPGRTRRGRRDRRPS